MAVTTQGLRALANELVLNSGEFFERGSGMPFQTALEKAAIAMRYATKTVQYYSPTYDYIIVQPNAQDNAMKNFNVGNEFGM